MNRSTVLRTLVGAAAFVSTAGFLLYVLVAWHVAWTLVSQPPDDVATSLAQGELLAATINAIFEPVLLFATGITALATWRTVREMRDGRDQERQLELERREDEARAAIRRDAWLLIGNVYAVTALVGRLERHDTQGESLRTRARQHRATDDAGVVDERRPRRRGGDAASRLQDAPGPWAEPAGELAQLVLDIVEVAPDVECAAALASHVEEPVQRLRDALPG